MNHLILSFSLFKKQSTTQANPVSSNDIIKKDENNFEPVLTWPNGVVPYEFDSALNKNRTIFLQAMEYFKAKTCIKFVTKTNVHLHWIKFARNDEICYSTQIERSSSAL